MNRTLACLALVALVAAAQDKPKMPLSLSKAVEIALAPEGSPRIALAEEAIRQAETRQAQARGALLPNVDGSYTFRSFTQNLQAFGLRIDLPAAGLAIPIFVGPVDVNDVRASASQTVFDLSAIKRYQAAKNTVGASKLDNDAARTQVTAQVARAYLTAEKAAAALDTAKANVVLGERLLRLARSTKEAGTGLGIEVTRAQVQLANSRQAQIQAVEDMDASRLQLLRVMGLNLNADIELTDALQYKPVDVPDLAQAVSTAASNRPELKSQLSREKSSRLTYDSVKYERLPSVHAFGDYGAIGVVDGSMLPTRTAGVTVKVPVFDGGRRDARRAESLSQLRQEEIRTRDLRQQVELDVRLAIDSLRSADNQVKVALEALQLSEKELEQAERRYEAGVATNVEVTDAQARLMRARENNVQAQYRHQLSRIDLSVALGRVNDILQ
ncbi:MAG: TolC family protein [Bryobacterales bacterium]|nr:TolC family protein [Bryobacterales bacterium]